MNNPLSKTVQAVKGFIRKCSRTSERQEALKEHLNANPDIAEEARKGFEGIQAGRYRRVSRRSGSV